MATIDEARSAPLRRRSRCVTIPNGFRRSESPFTNPEPLPAPPPSRAAPAREDDAADERRGHVQGTERLVRVAEQGHAERVVKDGAEDEARAPRRDEERPDVEGDPGPAEP